MNSRPILAVLSDQSHVESEESKNLRKKAIQTIEAIENDGTLKISQLPVTLLELLTDIVKPLFSRSQHPQLTSTGRKNLVSSGLPSTAQFSASSLFDEEKVPWKNGWCVALLEYVLSKYADLEETTRQKTIEAHFHLLIPPILHQIDDIDITYKISGCRCLSAMTEILISVKSNILKRTGLTDVFIDALKTNFLLLPTLTPEDESLMLLKELYPAFRSLVNARFANLNTQSAIGTEAEDIVTVTAKTSLIKLNNSDSKIDQNVAERQLRQSYLTLLLRHQLLHSLSHLSTGTGAGGTISLPLSTFLVLQVSWMVWDMGTWASWHLQELVPLLRNILMDPFGNAYPTLLLNAIVSIQSIMQVCWPRVRDRWWPEVLRSIVGCWLSVSDDEVDTKDKIRIQKIKEIKKDLKIVAELLENISGGDFQEAKEKLLKEDRSLSQLFAT